MFFLKILYPNSTIQYVDADYYFELFRANVNLTLKGNYEFELGLTRDGGLNAYYYQTVDFYLSTETVDPQIDFETDLEPLRVGYPADYFSVVW